MLLGRGLELNCSECLTRMSIFILAAVVDRLLSPDGRRSNVVYRTTAQSDCVRGMGPSKAEWRVSVGQPGLVKLYLGLKNATLPNAFGSLNPQSLGFFITSSPLCNKWKNSLHSINSVSKIKPVYNEDTNIT